MPVSGGHSCASPWSVAATLSAQPLDRLTGKVFDAAGAAVPDADVRVEAMFGFAGGDFLGQRTFAARTNAKGEWALLAFKAGIWVFDAAAPGRLPDSIALPFNLVAPAGSGIDRLTPVWHPVLRLSPAPAGRHRQDPALTPPRRPGRSVPIA